MEAKYTQIMQIKYMGPHSLRPIGGLVKFALCPRVYYVENRESVLIIGQMEFNIPQLRTLPITRSTCIRAAAMSKFLTASISANWSFSFSFGLSKVILLTPHIK